MGIHSRETQRKQEARKKLKIGASAAAGLLVTGMALGTYKLASGEGKGDNSTPTEQGQNPREMENAVPMPEDIKALLLSSPETKLEKLVNMPFREVKSFNLSSGNRVRIVQSGGEFEGGPISEEQLEKIEAMYQMFDKFLSKNPEFILPTVEADAQNNILSERTVHLTGQPSGKNVTVVMVPNEVDIGTFMGAPTTFTDPRGVETLSVVRPDTGMEGFFVEACQIGDFKITNQSDFSDVSDLSKLPLLAQEYICNPLAKAAYANSIGLDHGGYLNRYSNFMTGATDRPIPGGPPSFYIEMPSIGDPVAYSEIGSGTIPLNVSASLVFEPLY